MLANSVQSDYTTYDFDNGKVSIKMRAQKNFVTVKKRPLQNSEYYKLEEGDIIRQNPVIDFEIVDGMAIQSRISIRRSSCLCVIRLKICGEQMAGR